MMFRNLRQAAVFPISLSVFWGLSGIILWRSYGMANLVHEGYYQRGEARAYVAEMALIISILTAAAWLLATRTADRNLKLWQSGWWAGCLTMVFQIGYAALVVGWVTLGHHSAPLDDSAFLPLLGHVNARFFSEDGVFPFLIDSPLIGAISGVLYVIAESIRRPLLIVS